jgi:hypothetical protein
MMVTGAMMAWHIPRCALPQNAFLGRRLRSVYLPERRRAASPAPRSWPRLRGVGEKAWPIIDWLTGL